MPATVDDPPDAVMDALPVLVADAMHAGHITTTPLAEEEIESLVCRTPPNVAADPYRPALDSPGSQQVGSGPSHLREVEDVKRSSAVSDGSDWLIEHHAAAVRVDQLEIRPQSEIRL